MKLSNSTAKLLLWAVALVPVQSLAQVSTPSPQEILAEFPGTPVFFDDFLPSSEPIPDTHNWCTRLPYGGGGTPASPYNPLACIKRGALDFLNDELQRYREGNGEHEITDGEFGEGVLELNAFRDTSAGGQYRSGMVRSNVVFKPDANTDYYVRARVRAPFQSGTWPTFWLLPSNYEPEGRAGWPPELDILEIPNNQLPGEEAQGECATPASGKGLIYMHGQRNTPGPLEVECSERHDWIESGLLWTNDNACFMLNQRTDPRPVGAILQSRTTGQVGLTGLTGSLTCQPYQWKKGKKANSAAIILNLAIGGTFGGVPDPGNETNGGAQDTLVDYSFEIDYVEVYRKCRTGFTEPPPGEPPLGDFDTYSHSDGSMQRRIRNCVSAPAAPMPEIISPTPGSTLTSTDITFTWNGNDSGATDYFLTVSSETVNETYSVGTGTSQFVSGLPENGSTVTVTLDYQIDGVPGSDTVTYTAINSNPMPEIISPTPGSTLTSRDITFTWNGNDSGAIDYFLTVSSETVNETYDVGTGTSQFVSGLPKDGSTVTVRLDYQTAGGPGSDTVTYTAINCPPKSNKPACR